MYFPPAAFCLLLTARKGKTLLNYFPSPHTSPPPSDRFPAINSLIQKINLRKRRDSLILGGVIGVCTILLLLYTFHWWHRRTVENINCKSDQVFFVSPSFCCTSLFLNQEFTEVKNDCCGKESISLYFEVLIGSLFILLNYEKISIWELYILLLVSCCNLWV